MEIIGFLGLSGSGKDTCADYLIDKYGGVKLKLADPIKDACAKLFLFDDEQLNGKNRNVTDIRYGKSPRQIFQYFGTELFREQMTSYLDLDVSFWIYRLKLELESLESKLDLELESGESKLILIADIRFQDEIDFLKKRGATIYQINSSRTTETDSHISESNQRLINKSDIDGYIDNTGTIDELYKKLDSIPIPNSKSKSKSKSF